MQTFRPDVLPNAAANPLPTVLSANALKSLAQETAPVATVTEQAVEASGDSATLNPLAASIADLKALISRLNEATTAQDMGEALEAVKDFVNDQTNAPLIGGAIGQLSQMADAVMEAIEKDPSALGDNFRFSFNANFQQQTYSSDDYYKNVTSFSFSFSFQSDNTLMTGSMSSEELTEITDEGFSYYSNEAISINMVTMNANLDTNPVLEMMNNLIKDLTGIDVTAMLAAQPPEAALPEQPSSGFGVSKPYVSISIYELLKAQLQQIESTQQTNEKLLTLLTPKEPHFGDDIQLRDKDNSVSSSQQKSAA